MFSRFHRPVFSLGTRFFIMFYRFTGPVSSPGMPERHQKKANQIKTKIESFVDFLNTFTYSCIWS